MENNIKKSIKIVVEEPLFKIERAITLLDILLQDYGYNEPPSLQAITAFLNNNGELSETEKNSFTWMQEYNKVYQLIDMIFDLVLESKKSLEESSRE